MDKHDAVAEKRRDSIMTDLSSAKSQLTDTEQEASRLQTEKEKAQFELHAKKGEPGADQVLQASSVTAPQGTLQK